MRIADCLTAQAVHARIRGMKKQKNQSAVEPGSKGGAKGGKARAESLTQERRSEIASNAANARWKKHRENNENKSL